MSQLADDLRAAKALIDTPEKLAKGEYEDSSGRLCAIGALNKVMGKPVDCPFTPSGIEAALNAAAARTSGRGALSFNDDPATTHADIMALFDRAIAAAEAS